MAFIYFWVTNYSYPVPQFPYYIYEHPTREDLLAVRRGRLNITSSIGIRPIRLTGRIDAEGRLEAEYLERGKQYVAEQGLHGPVTLDETWAKNNLSENQKEYMGPPQSVHIVMV